MTDSRHDYPALISDRVIHERARLLIVSYLAAQDRQQVPFMEVQKAMNFLRGNLSIQLKTLEDAAYVAIEKRFVGRKPQTLISLTEKGKAAIRRYLDELETVLKRLRHDSAA